MPCNGSFQAWPKSVFFFFFVSCAFSEYHDSLKCKASKIHQLTMIVRSVIIHWQVPLSVEDIEAILDTLIYDGKVEKSIAASGAGDNTDPVKLYRTVQPLIAPTGLARTPCGVCPVSWWVACTAVHPCQFPLKQVSGLHVTQSPVTPTLCCRCLMTVMKEEPSPQPAACIWRSG